MPKWGKYKKSYRKEWETDPELKTWIIRGKLIFMSPYLICTLKQLLYGQVVVRLSAPQVWKAARRKREEGGRGALYVCHFVLF
jgi:hypothetical protein